MNMLQRVQFLNEAGRVERFHTSPGLKPENDACHSWHVAMLCSLLVEPEMPGPNLLMAALTHDMGELFAGDIPSPSKRAMGLGPTFDSFEKSTLANYDFCWPLAPNEQQVLTLADNLAGILWCCRERALGNLNVVVIAERWLNYIGQLEFTTLEQLEVFAAVVTMWESLRQGTAPSFDVYQGADRG